jgi:hypothetical protein
VSVKKRRLWRPGSVRPASGQQVVSRMSAVGRGRFENRAVPAFELVNIAGYPPLERPED